MTADLTAEQKDRLAAAREIVVQGHADGIITQAAHDVCLGLIEDAETTPGPEGAAALRLAFSTAENLAIVMIAGAVAAHP